MGQERTNRALFIWVLVVLAVIVLLPLLGVLGMMLMDGTRIRSLGNWGPPLGMGLVAVLVFSLLVLALRGEGPR